MNATKVREAYMTGKCWSDIREDEQLLNLRAGISDAMMLRGQGRPDMATLEIISKHVNGFLMDEYPFIRDKELGYILNLGISGELGQDTWVSGAAVMKWTRIYYRHAERIAVVDAEEKEQKESKRLTPEQVAQKNAEAFESALKQSWAFYQKHGTIFGDERDKDGKIIMSGLHLPQWAASVYNHYRKESKIPEPTRERVKEAEAKAQEALTKTGGYSWQYPADIFKQTRADWRDSFLLEMYYEDVINSRF